MQSRRDETGIQGSIGVTAHDGFARLAVHETKKTAEIDLARRRIDDRISKHTQIARRWIRRITLKIRRLKGRIQGAIRIQTNRLHDAARRWHPTQVYSARTDDDLPVRLDAEEARHEGENWRIKARVACAVGIQPNQPVHGGIGRIGKGQIAGERSGVIDLAIRRFGDAQKPHPSQSRIGTPGGINRPGIRIDPHQRPDALSVGATHETAIDRVNQHLPRTQDLHAGSGLRGYAQRRALKGGIERPCLGVPDAREEEGHSKRCDSGKLSFGLKKGKKKKVKRGTGVAAKTLLSAASPNHRTRMRPGYGEQFIKNLCQAAL